MSSDDLIGFHAMLCIQAAAKELVSSKNPLPFGLFQKFNAFIPKRTPDDIYEKEISPYWFGYAAALEEFIAIFGATEVIPFVEKRKK